MQSVLAPWLFWALLSAFFAALTAIFAKLGVADVGSDFATFVRTVVILLVLAAMLSVSGGWQGLGEISPRAGLFLVLSGLATGASWLCYFRALKLGDAARVAPVDKLSVVLVAVFAPWLAPYDPNQQNLLGRLKPPGTVSRSFHYWLGSDELGRDG